MSQVKTSSNGVKGHGRNRIKTSFFIGSSGLILMFALY